MTELHDSQTCALAEAIAVYVHDLNGLLFVIGGHATLIVERSADPAAKSSAATIRESVGRVADLTADFLAALGHREESVRRSS